MAPKLYAINVSPPCRAVSLVASALNIPLEYVETSLLNGEHKSPEFIKMNPQHTVPTLNDGGFIVWESHAIITYLINKYKPNSPLYPTDPEKRATIDQRLYFNASVLFAKLRDIILPIIYLGNKEISQKSIDDMHEAYDFLEVFLGGNDWFAGRNMTVADLSLIATVTSIDAIIPIDKSKRPRLVAWIKRCQVLPYYAKDNQEGLDIFASFLKSKLA